MAKGILSAAALFLVLSFQPAETGKWTMDKAHSKLRFTISHLTVSEVDGWFRDFDIKLNSSKDDFSDAVVEATINVNSIDTDNEQRDKHLLSADFFDAAKYPTITFKSKGLKKTEDKKYILSGDLTMHGVTKPIEVAVAGMTITHPQTKKTVAGFKAVTKVKRSDFGIGESFGNATVGDEVTITANLEFIKD
ncbi:MAG: YceI family protein [Bacteroidota bacterium]